MKRVFGFDNVGGLPVMACHEFEIGANGDLYHVIDGKPRAQVPPEGFEAYVEQWPECQSVIAGRVFNVAIDTLKPAVEILAAEIASDPVDNAEQIAYLQGELAKLMESVDNGATGSPASLEAAPPASPGV